MHWFFFQNGFGLRVLRMEPRNIFTIFQGENDKTNSKRRRELERTIPAEHSLDQDWNSNNVDGLIWN